MRINTGRYRGQLLYTKLPGYKHTYRPTMSKLKQAVFNILASMDKIQSDYSFLDICCGNGACGIEALSRGMGKTTFIDSSHIAISLTKLNLNKLNIPPSITSILHLDASSLGTNSGHILYDVVYIDPPYAIAPNFVPACLKALRYGKWLSPQATLLIEIKPGTPMPEDWHSNFEILDTRRYAGAQIIILSPHI